MKIEAREFSDFSGWRRLDPGGYTIVRARVAMMVPSRATDAGPCSAEQRAGDERAERLELPFELAQRVEHDRPGALR